LYASGLTVNRNKRQIIIHRLSLEKGHIEGIEIKSSVSYLGILISKSPKDRTLLENSKSYNVNSFLEWIPHLGH